MMRRRALIMEKKTTAKLDETKAAVKAAEAKVAV